MRWTFSCNRSMNLCQYLGGWEEHIFWNPDEPQVWAVVGRKPQSFGLGAGCSFFWVQVFHGVKRSLLRQIRWTHWGKTWAFWLTREGTMGHYSPTWQKFRPVCVLIAETTRISNSSLRGFLWKRRCKVNFSRATKRGTRIFCIIWHALANFWGLVNIQDPAPRSVTVHPLPFSTTDPWWNLYVETISGCVFYLSLVNIVEVTTL